MKKIIKLTESDLTKIVKKVLISESNDNINKIKELNKKYPGEKNAEWCAYAVLDGNLRNCYIRNCLGLEDKYCKNAKNCPSCLSKEFIITHTKVLSCVTSCVTTGKYDDMNCGDYEGNFYC
jgi:hypothetical protein